jgi:hypothetical protein
MDDFYNISQSENGQTGHIAPSSDWEYVATPNTVESSGASTGYMPTSNHPTPGIPLLHQHQGFPFNPGDPAQSTPSAPSDWDFGEAHTSASFVTHHQYEVQSNQNHGGGSNRLREATNSTPLTAEDAATPVATWNDSTPAINGQNVELDRIIGQQFKGTQSDAEQFTDIPQNLSQQDLLDETGEFKVDGSSDIHLALGLQQLSQWQIPQEMPYQQQLPDHAFQGQQSYRALAPAYPQYGVNSYIAGLYLASGWQDQDRISRTAPNDRVICEWPGCGKDLARISIGKHRETHLAARFPCKHGSCRHVAKTARDLERHHQIVKHRNRASATLISCLNKECDIQFSRHDNMIRHVRTQHGHARHDESQILPVELQQQYTCPDCQHTLPTMMECETHMREGSCMPDFGAHD